MCRRGKKCLQSARRAVTRIVVPDCFQGYFHFDLLNKGGIAMCQSVRGLAVLTLGILLAGSLIGQEPKQAPPPKATGRLPVNWSKIGLTAEQKEKIYGIQAAHREKIEQLRKELREVEKKQCDAMEKVLTDSQKARLRELAAEKAPKDDKKPQPTTTPPAKKEP